MDKYQRCNICKGSKVFAPLGGIERKCRACKGVGNVLIEDRPQVVIAEKIDKRSKAYRDSIGRCQ